MRSVPSATASSVADRGREHDSFPAIRGGLEAFAAAIAAVKRDGDLQPLRVTTTNAFASRWLVPRLPAWGKLHPEAPLEVIGTDSVLDLRPETAMSPSAMQRAGPRRQTALPRNS